MTARATERRWNSDEFGLDTAINVTGSGIGSWSGQYQGRLGARVDESKAEARLEEEEIRE